MSGSGSHHSNFLPEITKETDVYKVGSVAAVKAIHDTANPFLPYYLNMFPTQRAELTAFFEKVAPLCRVQTIDLNYHASSPEEDSTNSDSNGESEKEQS